MYKNSCEHILNNFNRKEIFKLDFLLFHNSYGVRETGLEGTQLN